MGLNQILLKLKSPDWPYFFIDSKLLGTVQSPFKQGSPTPYLDSLFNFSS